MNRTFACVSQAGTLSIKILNLLPDPVVLSTIHAFSRHLLTCIFCVSVNVSAHAVFKLIQTVLFSMLDVLHLSAVSSACNNYCASPGSDVKEET